MDNRRIKFLLVFFLIFFGMNFYVGVKLFQLIVHIYPEIRVAFFGVTYMLIALTIILGRMPLAVPIRKPIAWIGAHWLGVFIYLFLFFLVADIIILAGSGVRLIPAHELQEVRFYAGMAVILLTVAVVGYGLHNATKIINVSYEIQLKRNLTREMNIILISDLHLGDINSESRLKDIVDGIISLNPDIVCIVGDIFGDHFSSIRDPDRASKLLKGIGATFGVYAVFGNHDSGSSMPQMVDFLESSSIILLKDEHVIINDELVLIGRLDGSPIREFDNMSRRDFVDVLAEVAEGVDDTLPIVVMDHNPAHIGEYGDEVDLILAGHTHKGQIYPGGLFTRRMFVVDYGHYTRPLDGLQVIVSQGVHTWMMPMRVGSNNEIVRVVVR